MPKPAPMPTTVTIGTVVFDVIVDPTEWVRIEHAVQMTNSYGHTEAHAARMYINPDHSVQVQRLTLWHEVLHALAETVMGRPEWDNLGTEVDDREEAVVRAWEHPTLAVLRDNPDLVAYLTDHG